MNIDAKAAYHPREILWLRRSEYLNSAVILLALLVLAGWVFDIGFMKRPVPDLAAMNPTTALCFLLTGCAFHLLFISDRRKIPLFYVLAILPACIGLLHIMNVVGVLEWQVDSVLFRGELHKNFSGNVTDRMALNAALNFVLINVAVLLSVNAYGFRGRAAVHAGLIVALLSLFSFANFVYDVGVLPGTLSDSPMAIHTALAFGLMAMALAFLNVRFGYMKVISSSFPGGAIARALIPLILLLVIGLGYVVLQVQRYMDVNPPLIVSILVSGIALILVIVVLHAASVLNNESRLRQTAEESLEVANLELMKVNRHLELRTADSERHVTENERRLLNMIDESQDLIILMKPGPIFSFVSPSVRNILGYEPDEFISLNAEGLVNEEDIEMLRLRTKDLANGPNETLRIEYRLRHKDGHFVWVENFMKNRLDTEGMNSIVSNLRDIGDRKETEIKLQESELRYRNMFESAALGNVLVDQGGAILALNSRLAEMFGFTFDELIGKSIELLIPESLRGMHVQHRKHYHENPVRRMMGHERALIGLKKDGSTLNLEISLNYIRSKGEVNVVASVIDITTRMIAENKVAANERRFRAMIENISDGIVLNDVNAIIQYQSPSVTRILGYDAEERKGRNQLEYIHPDDRRKYAKLYKKVISSPRTSNPFQCRFMHKSGNYVWLEGVLTNLLHEDGIRGVVANYRDISERKKNEGNIAQLNTELEERVNTRTRELESANKELEAFSYSVSHDLRAPLRIIEGYSQILVEDCDHKADLGIVKHARTIQRNTKKMTGLIDDLLNFSQLSRKEIRQSHVSMIALVRDVIADLKAGGIAVPPGIRIGKLGGIYCDRNLLKQVWMNLISNAIKYTSHREKPLIEIGLSQQQELPVYYIRDNGAGFSMKYKDKLFGVFQRLHAEAEFGGTGVGLAIVQRIIKRHGGSVWAEGQEGLGATFYFTLPGKATPGGS
jgi:PAS domain S-box-containing protein